MSKRDYVGEIEQRRARGQAHVFLLPSRVKSIQSALARVSGEDQELLRYFPVALIATVEAFVRTAVQQILDARSDCFTAFLRTTFAKESKFTLAILGAVGGLRISAGELVGHLISVKGVEDIERVMSGVIGAPFHDALSTVYDRFAVEVEGKPKEPIISDLGSVLATLDHVFRLRHILAHEAPGVVELDRETVSKHIEGIAAFIYAASEVVSETIYPGYPLTQLGMNRAAAESAGAAVDLMRADLEWLEPRLPDNMRKGLADSQRAWEAYRDEQMEFEGLQFEGGSLEPMVRSSALEALAGARRDQLKRVAHLAQDTDLQSS